MGDYLMQLLERVAELEQQVAHLIVEGVVTEVQANPYRVKVNIGSESEAVITDWLPVAVPRAAHTIVWCPLEVDEAVTIISPAGVIRSGRVYPASYTMDYPAPSDNLAEIYINLGDDGLLIYNRDQHQLDIQLPGYAITNLISDGGINFTGDLLVDGNIDSTKNIHADGEVSDHTRTMQEDRDISNDHDHNVSGSKALKTQDW